jgi:hypothetical protein
MNRHLAAGLLVGGIFAALITWVAAYVKHSQKAVLYCLPVRYSVWRLASALAVLSQRTLRCSHLKSARSRRRLSLIEKRRHTWPPKPAILSYPDHHIEAPRAVPVGAEGACGRRHPPFSISVRRFL